MLSPRQMEIIMVEVSTGKEPSFHSPEADAYREEFTRDKAALEAKGGTYIIPHEIPETE